MDTILKVIFDGVLGALTFGVYYHIVSMEKMRLHNARLEYSRETYLNNLVAKKGLGGR